MPLNIVLPVHFCKEKLFHQGHFAGLLLFTHLKVIVIKSARRLAFPSDRIVARLHRTIRQRFHYLTLNIVDGQFHRVIVQCGGNSKCEGPNDYLQEERRRNFVMIETPDSIGEWPAAGACNVGGIAHHKQEGFAEEEP